MLDKKYHCPRCGNKRVVEYEDSFDCPTCKLEFRKDDFGELADEDILSLEEMDDFFKVFGDDVEFREE